MALVYRDYYFSMGCAKNGVGMGYKGILNVLNGFRVWYTSELILRVIFDLHQLLQLIIVLDLEP